MSRTNRSKFYSRAAFRHPRTTNEKKQLQYIANDPEIKEFSLSKMNRIQSRISERLPTAYSDIVISAYYETDYEKNY